TSHPLFDDRLDQLREALKLVYGKKARLESTLSYPAIAVTKNLWVYIPEQVAPFLEAGNYN
ncbi:MAG: hypothetical protein Q9N02_11945, partial [Ghiorsea sp.]|nr:hypothetical protein [Ghiorsea sp.]